MTPLLEVGTSHNTLLFFVFCRAEYCNNIYVSYQLFSTANDVLKGKLYQ